MHNWLALVGIHYSLIQGKVGGIQVLAGLAPSSQTVGCNIRTLWSHQIKAPVEIGRNWQKLAENGYVILPGPLLAEKNMSSNFTSKSIRGFSR
jgi:hypothetical protein